MRSKVINAAVTLVTVLVSLAFGEAILRAVVRLPMSRVLPEVRYAPHPIRRFTLLPDQDVFTYGAPARIDRRGFRATGATPAADGTAAVLALGDSFTFGLGVEDRATWPAQLQRLLSADLGREVRVANAGTISYGVFQELDLLKTSGLRVEPRVVVHALYWNDFMNARAPQRGDLPAVDGNGYFTWDNLSAPRGALRRLASAATSSSALLFSVRQAAAALRQSRSTAYGTAYQQFLQSGLAPSEWAPIEAFYAELRELAAEHDFVVISVILPVSDIAKGPAPHTHPYPAAARKMLARMEIPYLDTFQLWSDRGYGGDLFLPEAADAHLNADGYRAVAEALGRRLLESPTVRARLQR